MVKTEMAPRECAHQAQSAHSGNVGSTGARANKDAVQATMVVVAARRILPGDARSKFGSGRPRRVDAGRVPVDIGHCDAIGN